MATITIRDLDDSVRDQLRIRAARHHRSMEAEVREILAAAVSPPVDFLVDWHETLSSLDVEPSLPQRSTSRDVIFDE